MNISLTIEALEDLSAIKHPENIAWFDECPYVVDALRGSLHEVGWRGTLTEYFDKNPSHVERMADRAYDRLVEVENLTFDGSLLKLGQVSPLLDNCVIGLGTYGWKYDPDIIKCALDGDMRLIDTAETYGYGRVEAALGEIFIIYGGPLILASKVSRMHLSCQSIINAAERSVDRLGRKIDLYQIHRPNSAYPFGQSMKAMKYLLDEGIIGAVGVCNFSIDQIFLAQYELLPHKLASVQVRYSLLDRGVERALLGMCMSVGIPIIAYSPLGQKFSRLMKSDGGRVLTDVARRLRITEAQVALVWLMSWQGVIPIPRTNDVVHVREIVECMGIELDLDDLELLNAAFPILE